jgi:hypothetical protein
VLKTIVSIVGLFIAALFGAHQIHPVISVPAQPATVVQASRPAAIVASTSSSLPLRAFSTSPSVSPTAFASDHKPATAGVVLGASTKSTTEQDNFVTQLQLQTQLEEVANSLKQMIYAQNSFQGSLPASGGYTNNVALTNRIDKLANVTISNSTVHGLAGLTAADIPTDIIAGNYLPLAGGTLTGSIVMTNATSTNFFATTASSTNLFATTGSFGSLAGAAFSSLSPNYLAKWNGGT